MFFSCNNRLRNNKYTYTNILFVFPTLYIVFLNTINANQRELELYLQAYGGSLRQNGSKWILFIFFAIFRSDYARSTYIFFGSMGTH